MMRPKPRPEGMMKKKKKSNAPMKSIRPKARPPMATEAEIAAADRANKTVDRINKEGIPGMKAGGMMKKKGYAKGGMMKKGYAKGGKVRGAGRASKGVRPAKMVTMKGS